MNAAETTAEAAGSYLTFELDAADPTDSPAYALDIASVLQVIEPEPIAHVPLAPPLILGIMSYHGRIVTLFDPAPLIGRATQTHPLTQVVLLRQRRASVGVLGMKVRRTREIMLSQTLGAGTTDGGPCCTWAGELGGRPLHVLDAEALIDALAMAFTSYSRFGDARQGAHG